MTTRSQRCPTGSWLDKAWNLKKARLVSVMSKTRVYVLVKGTVSQIREVILYLRCQTGAEGLCSVCSGEPGRELSLKRGLVPWHRLFPKGAHLGAQPCSSPTVKPQPAALWRGACVFCGTYAGKGTGRISETGVKQVCPNQIRQKKRT